MRFELGLEQPDPARAARSAATIAASYIVGGLIPLAPYISDAGDSAGAVGFGGRDVAGAFRFRLDQGTLHGREAVASGAQTVLVGGLAAAAAFLIARLIHLS